jgi:hydrogenase nickel incorporation protein HypB
MCATCGCSGDGVTMESQDHHHDHGHDHAHGHDHTHDHEREGGHGHHHAGLVPHVHPHPSPRMVALERDVLSKNDLLAARNRGWLEGREILALNLMSSPGAGKTTLLERTVARLGSAAAIAVVEGDQATLRDAERIRACGARALQINTGTGCHLDAGMIADALRQLAPPARSLLFIENVGNLVCPALFDLGERARVVVASVTEGEDKPLKYPHMFRASDVVVLNKIDLLPYLSFDTARFVEFAHRIKPTIEVFEVSATRGDGLDAWCHWLRGQMAGCVSEAEL